MLEANTMKAAATVGLVITITPFHALPFETLAKVMIAGDDFSVYRYFEINEELPVYKRQINEWVVEEVGQIKKQFDMQEDVPF